MLSIITLFFYLIATLLQALTLFGNWQVSKIWVLSTGLIAIGLHTLLLYHWIDIGQVQNLTFLNMLSLVAWLIALLIVLTAFRKPVANLTILIFPVAAFSILLVQLFPGQEIIDTKTNPRQLTHILFSVLTFSVLSVAGLQAILLALVERQLRSRPSSNVIQQLPALETMEKLLFQMIGLGFLLLTVLLGSSLYFYYPTLNDNMLQKTILVIVAWVIFAWLLGGRYYLGWRGRKAIYGTLSGVLLLAIVYFGSQLFWEPH
ncbi:MAG: cytochrome c biogenesis protein CcsA [Gammaproteobacteria bacterium]